jgi:multisubunit Na+/H+ antiporter MnhC subunit
MKTSVIVGVILIVLGAVGLFYKGFSYESKETVAKIGPIEATAETEKNVPIPEVLSIVAIVIGVGVIAVGARK